MSKLNGAFVNMFKNPFFFFLICDSKVPPPIQIRSHVCLCFIQLEKLYINGENLHISTYSHLSCLKLWIAKTIQFLEEHDFVGWRKTSERCCPLSRRGTYQLVDSLGPPWIPILPASFSYETRPYNNILCSIKLPWNNAQLVPYI